VLTGLYDLQDTHFPDEETPQTTTEIGLKLVKQLKNSKDKTCVTLLPNTDQRQDCDLVAAAQRKSQC
jgi:hypothetical protein